jgi:hypothetical protein
MNRINPDTEIENILHVLDGSPELYLRDIHDELEAMEDSQFVYSPDYGDRYNDERFIVKSLMAILQNKREFASTDAGKWSLTDEGRQRVNDL